MGAPAFMKEFRERMNLPMEGGLFGSAQSRVGSCDSCLAKFGLLKRKHPCDQCGADFCAACVRSRRCPRCRTLAARRPALLALRPRDLRALLRARGLALPPGVSEKAELVDLLLLEPAAAEPQPQPPEELASSAGLEQPISAPAASPGHTSPFPPQWGGPFLPEEETPSEPEQQPPEQQQEPPPPVEPAAAAASGAEVEPLLEQVESEEQLGQLTVMQMKLMLTRNFVDYRGCCEKAELHEKLCWLWRQKRKHRGDLQAEEDLCKICMEDCVDCVILDCGHMCTCTSCGKQLSECPVCCQYVVRVVHVFRA